MMPFLVLALPQFAVCVYYLFGCALYQTLYLWLICKRLQQQLGYLQLPKLPVDIRLKRLQNICVDIDHLNNYFKVILILHILCTALAVAIWWQIIMFTKLPLVVLLIFIGQVFLLMSLCSTNILLCAVVYSSLLKHYNILIRHMNTRLSWRMRMKSNNFVKNSNA